MKPGETPEVLFPHEIRYAWPYVSVTVCWSTAGQEKVGLGSVCCQLGDYGDPDFLKRTGDISCFETCNTGGQEHRSASK